MISIWWSDAKQLVIQNLIELRLAKFRQLTKFRPTFVRKLAWRLPVLLRGRSVADSMLERSAALPSRKRVLMSLRSTISLLTPSLALASSAIASTAANRVHWQAACIAVLAGISGRILKAERSEVLQKSLKKDEKL